MADEKFRMFDTVRSTFGEGIYLGNEHQRRDGNNYARISYADGTFGYNRTDNMRLVERFSYTPIHLEYYVNVKTGEMVQFYQAKENTATYSGDGDFKVCKVEEFTRDYLPIKKIIQYSLTL